MLNSHLLRGAGLILTDRSVADPGFWQLFRDRAGTSLAGVPYTFDLLDRVGFAEMALPHLRTSRRPAGGWTRRRSPATPPSAGATVGACS